MEPIQNQQNIQIGDVEHHYNPNNPAFTTGATPIGWNPGANPNTYNPYNTYVAPSIPSPMPFDYTGLSMIGEGINMKLLKQAAQQESVVARVLSSMLGAEEAQQPSGEQMLALAKEQLPHMGDLGVYSGSVEVTQKQRTADFWLTDHHTVLQVNRPANILTSRAGATVTGNVDLEILLDDNHRNRLRLMIDPHSNEARIYVWVEFEQVWCLFLGPLQPKLVADLRRALEKDLGPAAVIFPGANNRGTLEKTIVDRLGYDLAATPGAVTIASPVSGNEEWHLWWSGRVPNSTYPAQFDVLLWGPGAPLHRTNGMTPNAMCYFINMIDAGATVSFKPERIVLNHTWPQRPYPVKHSL